MRIRISKAVERINDATGNISYSQAINVLQFPNPDATLWHQSFSAGQLYPPGTYDAEPLFVAESWTDRASGKTRREVRTRWVNLAAVEA